MEKGGGPAELEEAMLAKGEQLISEGRSKEAREQAEEVIRLNPKEAGAYLLRGKSYYLEEKFEKAFESLQKAAELRERDGEILRMLGYCSIAMQKYEEALGVLLYAREIEPKNIEIIYALAVCYVILEDEKKAKEMVKKAFVLDKEGAVRMAAEFYEKYFYLSPEVTRATKKLIERLLEELRRG